MIDQIDLTHYPHLQILHEYANRLDIIGLHQVAADYDYLCAWFVSKEWPNRGTHLEPHPNGINTVAPYSNNCAIPFCSDYSFIHYYADNNDAATSYLQAAYSTLTEMLDYYSADEEQDAINEYINYTSEILSILGYEITPPEPDNYVDSYLSKSKSLVSVNLYRAVSSSSQNNTIEWVERSIDNNISYPSTLTYTLYDSNGDKIAYDSHYKIETINNEVYQLIPDGHTPIYNIPYRLWSNGTGTTFGGGAAYYLVNYNGNLAIKMWYVGYYGYTSPSTTKLYGFKLKLQID